MGGADVHGGSSHWRTHAVYCVFPAFSSGFLLFELSILCFEARDTDCQLKSGVSASVYEGFGDSYRQEERTPLYGKAQVVLNNSPYLNSIY
jgi:hypothetical protein